MNHCLIQAVINSAPQMRYTKENQTPIAEMIVNFKGLRSEDPTRDLKIIGWGNIAQEMVDELKEGQNIVIEGRLKMDSVTCMYILFLPFSFIFCHNCQISPSLEIHIGNISFGIYGN